jgi:hypothetical protein
MEERERGKDLNYCIPPRGYCTVHTSCTLGQHSGVLYVYYMIQLKAEYHSGPFVAYLFEVTLRLLPLLSLKPSGWHMRIPL